MKKLINLIVFILIASLNGWAQEATEVIRVACVGNSITFGAGIANRDRDSYPSVLGQMLGRGYEVRNFGFSARTMLMKGDHPYMKEQMFQDALKYNPDIVVIKLGTNVQLEIQGRPAQGYADNGQRLQGDTVQAENLPVLSPQSLPDTIQY